MNIDLDQQIIKNKERQQKNTIQLQEIKPKQLNVLQFQNDSGDEFQTHKDQLLTYSFSTHGGTNTLTLINKKNKPRKNNQEKHSLSILKYPIIQNINNQEYSNYNQNKNKRHLYSNSQGKVIRIGQAVFKSNFQCGNLGQVQQIKSGSTQINMTGSGGSSNGNNINTGIPTYKISMDRQYNSNRLSSWFYFKCQGLKGQVNFIITGFTKSTSLYNQGMKICCRELNQLNTNLQWKRAGSKISYVSSHANSSEDQIYELRFTYLFRTLESRPVQFAYCFPYEYSRVFKLIKSLRSSQSNQLIYQSLGKTYEGRDIPLLTVGNPNANRSIVISARVHPGQTVASFIIQGFLKQLLSNCEFSHFLKQQYLFKIVPMINPDGVVRGHYRFSAAGYDLNRRWKHCYQSSHPQIYYLKNMIKKLNKQKKVIMYIDIHGHSRKKNVFFYGCCSGKSQYSQNNNHNFHHQDEDNMSKAKQFPYLMQKINSNFKYQYCTFSISRDKQGTARISMWKQLHIEHVYTLEASLCGSINGGNFFQDDYLKIGKSLLEGISIYLYEKPAKKQKQQTKQKKSKNKSQLNNPQTEKVFQKYLHILQEAKKQLKSSPYLINMGMNEVDSGSDSQPQQGIIPQQQRVVKSTTLNLDSKIKIQDKKQKKSQFKSPSNIITQQERKSIKINIRMTPQGNRAKKAPQELKFIIDDKIQNLVQQQLLITQKRLSTNTVTNLYSYNSQNLNSLTSDSLSRKNERVHSKQISRNFLQKLRNARINSENHVLQVKDNEQDQRKKLQIMNRNLLKTRQGVQYRRVRIIAEEMKRKTSSFSNSIQQAIPMVRGIITVNNELNTNKKRIKSIAPSFYPQSSQKTKRFSIETTFKNNSNQTTKHSSEMGNRKLFINGDQLIVHCKGTKIYI